MNYVFFIHFPKIVYFWIFCENPSYLLIVTEKFTDI
jgi:hypothetical protein